MGACVRARVCVFVSFFSLVFFFRNFYFVWKRKKFFNKKFKKKKMWHWPLHPAVIAFEVRERNP